MSIFFGIVYNFPKLAVHNLVPFPSISQKVFVAKHPIITITRASVIALGPQ